VCAWASLETPISELLAVPMSISELVFWEECIRKDPDQSDLIAESQTATAP